MTPDNSVNSRLDGMSPPVGPLADTIRVTGDSGAASQPGWWRTPCWPVGGAFALLILGLLYSFFSHPVVPHIQYWIAPADIGATFRDAHSIIWDGEGRVYNS